MRRMLTTLALLLAAGGPAFAQGNRGAFALDAMFAPTAGLGFGYYVTDGLSLRPWLGLGYSGYDGFYANVGGQLRYEFGAGWTVSPYVSASAQYTYSDATPVGATGSPANPTLEVQSSGAQLGAGAGVRFRVLESLSLFTEGRVIHATYPLTGTRSGWSSFDIDDRTRGEVVFGLSYLLR